MQPRAHRICMLILLALSISSASAKTPDELWNLNSYELPNGQLDVAKLQHDYQKAKAKSPSAQTKATQKRTSLGPAAGAETSGVTALPSVLRTAVAQQPLKPSQLPLPPPPDTSFQLLLRKNFADVGLFSQPSTNAQAQGAQFSWSSDAIAKNTTWVGNGTIALPYSYFVEDIRNPFIGVTLAPYLTFNREISGINAQNAYVLTNGLSGEIGRKSDLFPWGADYVRGTGAVVEDNIHGTTVSHGAIEWLPTYTWLAGTLPLTYLNYNFTPELEAEYDNTNAPKKTIAFSGQQQSLRIGPMAKLWFKVVAPPGAFGDFLNSFYGTVTYHYWGETYSGRYNGWLDAELHYNLDPNGNLALAFSYQRGRTEDAGVDTNMYTVTLAAKACADLLNFKSC